MISPIHILIRASVLILVLALVAGCKHQPDEFIPLDPISGGGITCDWPGAPSTPANCDPGTIYFQQQVMPIIMRSCALTDPNNSDLTCHHVTVDGNQDLNFTNFGNIVEESDDILEAIQDTDPDDHMPPYSEEQLTQQEIDIIEQWISQGSNLNSCANCDTANYTYSGKIAPMVSLHCTGGCHAGSSPAAGLNLSNAVVLKDNAARAWFAINGCTIQMPPVGPPLTACQKQQFYNWMANGADITN